MGQRVWLPQENERVSHRMAVLEIVYCFRAGAFGGRDRRGRRSRVVAGLSWRDVGLRLRFHFQSLIVSLKLSTTTVPVAVPRHCIFHREDVGKGEWDGVDGSGDRSL